MKHSKHFLILLALTSAACGKSSSSPGACASSVVVGSWTGTVGGAQDTLSFGASCTYTDALCQGNGTYPNLTASSGQALITITSTNAGATCLPVGQTSCTYSITGSTLTYNCGGGNLTFTKQ